MSIDGRLAFLSALKPRDFSFEAFTSDLLGRCKNELAYLTGDSQRDLDTFKVKVIGDYHDIHGLAPAGHLRLLLSVAEREGPAVEATVICTKGAVEIDPDALGQSGLYYGNRIHLARGFDIVLETAICHGATQLEGKPIDERVRALYVLMGFANGELFDLSDDRSRERAVIWIDTQYQDNEARFADFRRPW